VTSVVRILRTSRRSATVLIVSVADAWERTGKLAPALDTLLRRTPPRVAGVEAGAPLLGGTEANETSVIALVAGLDRSAVAVQGPPGAGKTRVASAAITELAVRGKRVGVTSNSHDAIKKLIEEVQKRALTRGVSLRVTKVNRDSPAARHRKARSRVYRRRFREPLLDRAARGQCDVVGARRRVPGTLASGQNVPQCIAADSKSIYWTDTGGGTVMKVAKP
jgi:Rad3-related DNA helicase